MEPLPQGITSGVVCDAEAVPVPSPGVLYTCSSLPCVTQRKLIHSHSSTAQTVQTSSLQYSHFSCLRHGCIYINNVILAGVGNFMFFRLPVSSTLNFLIIYIMGLLESFCFWDVFLFCWFFWLLLQCNC